MTPDQLTAAVKKLLTALKSGEVVLVPKEPTPAMLEAGAMEVGDSFRIHDERQVEEIYRAMLAAKGK